MKNFKVLLVAVIAVLGSASVFAQSTAKPKIIAVVNTADWCSVCKNNGQRAMGALMENNKDGIVQFVMNDITSAETTKKSQAELDKVGIAPAMKNYKASGVVYFFDATSKAPLTQVTVANSNEELAYVIGEVKKSAK